jgi:FkbM family methyltransferase
MSKLRRIAGVIRHLPGLERAEGFWRIVRPLYHRVLDRGDGVEILVGNCACVRVPVRFLGSNWEEYEPVSVAAFQRWVQNHRGGCVLDVGSALGIYSAVALFASDDVKVVAFDSDLASVAATREMCRYAKGNRLQVVQGLLADVASESISLATAEELTGVSLAALAATGIAAQTRYVCLTDPGADSVRRLCLDDLFPAEPVPAAPALLKCDVEGAELCVLQGARRFLAQTGAELLLSVHPPALPDYGHSVQDVRSFLEAAGYRITVIAVDHEEHWWCDRPRAAGF